MNLHGFALLCAAAACIGAAGALNYADQSVAEGGVVADADAPEASCMVNGFDTDEGRVGCLVQTSHAEGSVAQPTLLDRLLFGN